MIKDLLPGSLWMPCQGNSEGLRPHSVYATHVIVRHSRRRRNVCYVNQL